MQTTPKSANAEGVNEAVLSFSTQLGNVIRAAIIEGIQDGLHSAELPEQQPSTSPALGRPRGGNAAAAYGKTACAVTSCGLKSVAKGLCGKHYGKARKLGFAGASFTDAQLRQLAVDGRSTRHAVKAG